MSGEREPRADVAGPGTARVTVVLFGNLASLAPAGAHGRLVVEVGAGDSVSDVLDAVAVPGEARTFLTLDGRRATADAAVHDGAELRVIVPLGGG